MLDELVKIEDLDGGDELFINLIGREDNLVSVCGMKFLFIVDGRFVEMCDGEDVVIVVEAAVLLLFKLLF